VPRDEDSPEGWKLERPLVKWVGGKRQLVPELYKRLPIKFHRYVEPFVGGGALFFQLRPQRALLSDVNDDLIATYTFVRDCSEEVLAFLRVMKTNHDKEFYYRVRAEYNADEQEHTLIRAAQFLYLNKTCFNGVHRVNRYGKFNVPIGSYVEPDISNAILLSASSVALRPAALFAADFEYVLLEHVTVGDFVYMDPPYVPVSTTADFTMYAQDGFDDEDQLRLRRACDVLTSRGVKWMLSNSSAPRVFSLYGDYRIEVVQARRSINSHGTGRGPVDEVIVRNY